MPGKGRVGEGKKRRGREGNERKVRTPLCQFLPYAPDQPNRQGSAYQSSHNAVLWLFAAVMYVAKDLRAACMNLIQNLSNTEVQMSVCIHSHTKWFTNSFDDVTLHYNTRRVFVFFLFAFTRRAARSCCGFNSHLKLSVG